ncbi:hypothetical protein BRC86_08360 [Halobacteriales archaeon QS_3_64_16]|nr:MAG: hypothetical protein BRC86_08360 [Halobacteriales archaeon QS_3_64_16]
MNTRFQVLETIGLTVVLVIAIVVGIALTTAIEGEVNWLLVLGATVGALGSWSGAREKAIDRCKKRQKGDGSD